MGVFKSHTVVTSHSETHLKPSISILFIYLPKAYKVNDTWQQMQVTRVS